MNPFSDWAAANSLTVLPPLTRVSLVRMPSRESSARWALESTSWTSVAARHLADVAELEALVGQRAQLVGLHDRRVHVEPVARALRGTRDRVPWRPGRTRPVRPR